MTGESIDVSGDGGVLKKILREGEGDETPKSGFTVSLHYTGTLLDGTQFDSSRPRNQPFEFNLGSGAVIKGFEMGIPTMKKGEKCLLTCKPEYAYGSAGSPPTIPADATLNFELEMLGWMGEDVSPEKTGEIERFILEAGSKHSTPSEGDSVEIKLIGKYENRIFDERDGLAFDLIEAPEFDVVKGVQVALEKMLLNETSRFVIKPNFAFGKTGSEKFNIPPDATIEYTVKLKKFVSVGKVWKMDVADCISRAQLIKDKGANYIKKERYQTALSLFKHAGTFLEQHSTEEANKIKLAIALNTALCYQKLNCHMEGKTACNDALKLDPNNIKAFYRRGLFLVGLWELEQAAEDFNKVSRLFLGMQLIR